MFVIAIIVERVNISYNKYSRDRNYGTAQKLTHCLLVIHILLNIYGVI